MANVINLVVRAADATNPGLTAALRSTRRTVRRMRATMGQGWRATGRRAGQNFARSFRRAADNVRTGWGNIGSTVGRSISDGMANGFGNGLRTAMSNPFVAAAVLALAAGVASALGAALAAALVLTIGGAFTGLGVLAAFQADKVKDKWAKTLSDLKPLFEDAATPLLPVIEHARKQLVRVATAFAPHFKQALAGAAPFVETFMDHIIRGFEKLGRVASEPLEQAFNTLMVALGPMLEDTLEDIGESLAQLANTVRDHSTEIATAFNMVMQLIVVMIEIINFLAEAWSFMLRTASEGFGLLLGGISRVLEAMSKIPGMGFLSGAAADVRRLADQYQGLGDRLDHANRKRKLEVDIASFKARLAQARSDLQKTSDKKARAKITANINDLQAKVRQAQFDLARLDGRSVSTYVYTNYISTLTTTGGGRATGGIIGAATGGARSNMTMVGEHGPELVSLPGGSRVTSNEKSRQLLAGSGGGPTSGLVAIDINLGGSRLGRVLVDIVRGEVLSQGGDAQAVLGERLRSR